MRCIGVLMIAGADEPESEARLPADATHAAMPDASLPGGSSETPVYFFLHIPKTAGQTLAFHLTQHRPNETAWVHWRKRLPMRIRAPRAESAKVRALIGHGLTQSFERYFIGRDIRRILLLREPLSLQLSLYNYRMINNLVAGRGTYSFALHLKSQPRNFIAHWLLLHWLKISWYRVLSMSDGEKYRILNSELARFWFVGAYTDCDALIRTVSHDLSLPPSAPLRNSTREWTERYKRTPLTEEDLEPSVRTKFRRERALDFALWENWRNAKFATHSVRPSMLEYPYRRSLDDAFSPLFMAKRFFYRDILRLLPFIRSPAHLRGTIICAERACNAADWESAVRYYREASLIEPNAAWIWVQYGNALKEFGDWVAAEEAYQHAIRKEPQADETRLLLNQLVEREVFIEPNSK